MPLIMHIQFEFRFSQICKSLMIYAYIRTVTTYSICFVDLEPVAGWREGIVHHGTAICNDMIRLILLIQ